MNELAKQTAWNEYVRSLEWDCHRGMFVKQPAFWSFVYVKAIWCRFIPDITLFRGTVSRFE